MSMSRWNDVDNVLNLWKGIMWNKQTEYDYNDL